VVDNGVAESPEYLLGLLNSRLLSWYITTHSPIFSGGYFKFSAPYLQSVPIRRIDWTSEGDVKKHDTVFSLVTGMQELRAQLSAVRTERDHQGTQRRIDALLHAIDSIAYELYDLTSDQISVVESAFEEPVASCEPRSEHEVAQSPMA
jgi:hypothetical protein